MVRKPQLHGFEARQNALVDYLRLNIFGHYSSKPEQCHCYNDRLIRQYSDWLNEAIHFSDIVLQNLPSTSVTTGTHIIAIGIFT